MKNKTIMDVTETIFDNLAEYQKITSIKARKMKTPFCVKTLEGIMTGKAGDYLAIGVNGEKYIIDKEIFKKTYQKVINNDDDYEYNDYND